MLNKSNHRILVEFTMGCSQVGFQTLDWPCHYQAINEGLGIPSGND